MVCQQSTVLSFLQTHECRLENVCPCIYPECGEDCSRKIPCCSVCNEARFTISYSKEKPQNNSCIMRGFCLRRFRNTRGAEKVLLRVVLHGADCVFLLGSELEWNGIKCKLTSEMVWMYLNFLSVIMLTVLYSRIIFISQATENCSVCL